MSDEQQRRVPPSPDRPRVAEDLEEQLAPLDQKSSDLYTLQEDNAARLDRIIEAISGGAVTVAMPEGDTAVHRLQDATAAARRRDTGDGDPPV